MKTFLLKTIIVILASFMALSSASAIWQCNSKNAKDEKWVGTGESRDIATANAMKFCAAHSKYARNCHITRCDMKK